jgi:hypothetical protein
VDRFAGISKVLCVIPTGSTGTSASQETENQAIPRHDSPLKKLIAVVGLPVEFGAAGFRAKWLVVPVSGFLAMERKRRQ